MLDDDFRKEIKAYAEEYAAKVQDIAQRVAEQAVEEYQGADPVDLSKLMFIVGWNMAEKVREDRDRAMAEAKKQAEDKS